MSIDMRSADLFTRIIGKIKHHRAQHPLDVDAIAEADQEQARIRAVLLDVEVDLNDPTTAAIALKLATVLLEERQRDEIQLVTERGAPAEIAKTLSLVHMALTAQNVTEAVVAQYGLGIPAVCTFCDG